MESFTGVLPCPHGRKRKGPPGNCAAKYCYMYCGEEQADYLATMAMEQWERYKSMDYSVFTFFVRTGLTYTQ